MQPSTFCSVKDCHACAYKTLSYEDQLFQKNETMAALFGEVLVEDGGELRPILADPNPQGYRSKVTTPVAPGRRGPHGGREILTGIYKPGTHQIVSTRGCPIENPKATAVIAAIPPLMKKFKIVPYDEDRAAGFLRYAIVRVGHNSEETLVTLVTHGDDFPASKAFCRALVKACPFVTTVVQNINTAKTNTILGAQERCLYGPGFILDTLEGLRFRISSHSFYQVNSGQTERLYDQALSLAGLENSPRVLDSYCGTGTIGLAAAKRGAASVVGVDSVASAIEDARLNARHNGINNASFVVADATEFLESYDGEGFDVAFLDPPRAGASPRFLEVLAALNLRAIVYISCNPNTQKRDIDLLRHRGFGLKAVQPVDMFPYTDHIESIALLEKKG